MMRACFARLGGELRQSLARKLVLGSNTGPAMLPALCILSRGMASSKLFVGGLSWGTDEEMLREAFSAYGGLNEVKIINDRDTGRSRGFGFVTFASEEDAEAAQKALDGQNLSGRIIRVNYATSPGSGPHGGATRGFSFGGGGGEFGGENGANGGSGHRFGILGNEGGSGGNSGGFGTEKTGFGPSPGGSGSEQREFSRSSGGLGSEQGGFGSSFGGLSSEQGGTGNSSRGLSIEQGAFSHSSGELRSFGGSIGSNLGAFGGDSGTVGRSTDFLGNGRTVFGQTSGGNSEGLSSIEAGRFGRTLGAESHSPLGSRKEGGGFGRTLGAESHSPLGSSKEGGGFGQAIGGFGTEKHTSREFGNEGGGSGRAVGGFGAEDGGVAGGCSFSEYGSPRVGSGFGSSSRAIDSEGDGGNGQKGLGLEGSFDVSTGLFNSEKKDFGVSLGSFDSNSSTDSWTGLNRISGGFSNKARRMRRAAGGLSMNSSSPESWKSLDSSYGSLFSHTSESSESNSKLGPDFLKDLNFSKGANYGDGSEPNSDSSGSTAPTTNASADSSDWRTLLDSTLSESVGLRSTMKETSLDASKLSSSTIQSSFSSPENWRRLFDGITVGSADMNSAEDNSPSLCRTEGSDIDSTDKNKVSFSDNWRNLLA